MTFNSKDINKRQHNFYKLNTYLKINGAQNVASEAAILSKVIINTASTGSLYVYDSSATSTATPILSISAAAKDQFILDVLCTSGIYCVPVSCSPTLIYRTE